MGIFKEEINFLESIERRQTRIWPDSADYGLRKKDMTEAEVDRLRDVLTNLLELPGSGVEWSADRPSVQRQYRLVIMWSGRGNRVDATQCNVLYYKGRKNEFFSVHSRHVFTNENGVLQKTKPWLFSRK